MTWEYRQLHRTLFIEVTDHPEGKKYSIGKFFRVRRQSGETFLEPVPSQFLIEALHGPLRCDAIEFIEPPTIRRNDTGGDLSFTHSNGDACVVPTACAL